MMRRIVTGAALVLTAVLVGCANTGPDMIRSGRPAYNDAILATNDEQLLQNIVRMRFGDSLGFLTVSAVTANMSLTATGNVDLGFGPSTNYQGNLVPFHGTLATEQNPTISYVPLSGDRMVRQLLGQTPIDLSLLLIGAAQDHKGAWNALVSRVNGIRNPDFIDPPARVLDPRFEEIADLINELQQRDALQWVRLSGEQTGANDIGVKQTGVKQTGNAILLHGYSPASFREVTRLLELLGIPKPAGGGSNDVVVPIEPAVGSPQPGTIEIEPRSLFQLMQLGAAGIKLPADIAASAKQYPELGPVGKRIRILSAASRPAQARVAVEYRGRWYYIEETDQWSKEWFWLLQLLANSQVPEGLSGSAPVLTLPAGRR